MTVTVPPSGYAVSDAWRGVAGATGGRVTSASVTVRPDLGGPRRSLGVAVGARRRVQEIVVDAGPVPLRALRIPGLVRVVGEDETPINGPGALTGSLRLIVTPSGAPAAPVVAVPPLPRRGQLPAQLTGGSLTGSLLVLPDLVGRLTVRLVEGDTPEDMTPQDFHHGDVEMFAPPMPVGLHVDDPGGAEVSSLAGLLRTPASHDLTAAVNRYVAAEAPAGGSLSVGATIRSDVVGRASVTWAVSGARIERAVRDRLSVEVAGAPTEVVLPPPHPGRAPRANRADVTVVHHGVAVHPVSDPLPATDSDLSGPTVRDRRVVRSLPPRALDGLVLRRVAVIGWPRDETDLTLSVLDASASVTGLTAATARTRPEVVWFDVGELLVDRPVELALTATRGAFLWVAAPEPLAKVAVGAEAAGERVRVGGVGIDLTGPETVVHAAPVVGTDRWPVATDQFCTVTLSNLVMEFAP